GALAPRGCRPDAPGAPGKPHCSAPGFGRRRARVHPRSQPRRGSRPPLRSSWARDIETARASSLLTADTVEVEARTNDHRGLSHIWEIDFFWIDAQLLVYVKKLRPNRVGSATDEATAVPLSRSENGERSRRAARQSRKRQAAGGRAVADAHAQHAVRTA